MQGAISESEMWRLPWRRFNVYLRNVCRVQGEQYLDLMAIAGSPYMKDGDRKTLIRNHELIAKGTSPIKQTGLRTQALKALRKAKQKKK